MNVTNCRMCGSGNLKKFLDLGSCPPADQFLFSHQLNAERSYPLEVMSCQGCGLAQLSYVVPGEILYCNEYPYEASTTKTACEHWRDFANDTWFKTFLKKKNLVVDIGSNVGVLLQPFKEKGLRVIGVDAAENMAQIAMSRGIETIVGFFNRRIAESIVEKEGKASVITATNVFAHIHNLNAFMDGINVLLDKYGTFIVESPHLMGLIKNFSYDTVYHEHLSYLSVKPLVSFLDRFGLVIYDIQRQDNHGESFRYFIGNRRFPVSPIVDEIIKEEEDAGIYNINRLRIFAEAVSNNRGELRKLLFELKEQGKRMAVVSTPAKGMTLLNYCDLGHGLFEFATEKAKLKIGKCTPGTHIPIVSDEMLLVKQPDYALLLAWNFATEIMNNLKEFASRGSKFIIPIPHPQIV